MAESKKVLMICYFFPPYGTSGSVRSLHFAKNLPAHSWEPLVLSVSESKNPWVSRNEPIPEGLRVERSAEWPLSNFVRFLHGALHRVTSLFGVELSRNYFQELLCIPDSQIAWWSTFPGVRLAKTCDVIYVSCSPFSSAWSAVLIKKFSGRPLVVDFRDVYSINAYWEGSRFRQWFESKLERVVLKAADVFIANTPGAGKLYREHYPEFAEKVRVIPNGYDWLLPASPKSASDEEFVILHAGSFYGQRTPDLLLTALAELENKQIRFVQIGPTFDVAPEFLERVQIEFTGSLPREEVLERMRNASLLYLKQQQDSKEQAYVAVAGKTYEYLATGLPILVDCPLGDNRSLVEEYGVHHYVLESQTVAEVKAAIEKAFAQRLDRRPEIGETFKREFSREFLTEKLAECLESVSTKD